jgi:peptidoglycan hydrolase-like protein with peptidoglycan-binding domain
MSALQWYHEVDFTPQQYSALKEGDQGPAVKRLQYLLNENGLNVVKTGVFDKKTVSAVTAFQRGQMIVTDGTVCEKTWLRLLKPANDDAVFVQTGDQGNDVLFVQERLRDAGFSLTVDGDFGPGTRRQLLAFQKQHQLAQTGIVDVATFKKLAMVAPDDRQLSQDDIVRVAKLLNVPVSAIMAVNAVESRGSGFFSNNLAAILYERHIMRRRLNHHRIDPTPYMRSQPNIVSDKTGGYLGGVREYDRLRKAADIHHVSAHESASWGLFQIMGYHWDHLNYESVDQYVSLMQESESNQLIAFSRFIKADDVLLQALRRQDWTTFARRYNGPNFAKNQYDVKMAREFDRFFSRGFG